MTLNVGPAIQIAAMMAEIESSMAPDRCGHGRSGSPDLHQCAIGTEQSGLQPFVRAQHTGHGAA
jgi:hypothetical protein